MLWWILTNWSSRIWFILSIWWQDLTLSLYHHSWLCAVRVLCAKCSSTRPNKRNIEINFRDTLTRLCNVSISFADRCNGVWRRLFPSHFVMQHNYHWLQSISREIGTEQFSSLSSETGAAPPPPTPVRPFCCVPKRTTTLIRRSTGPAGTDFTRTKPS